jgi:hypothetical protein
MSVEITCPTDFKPVNENKIRLTALWVVFCALIYLRTNELPAIAILLVDFFLRAFNFGKYSPLHLLSNQVIHSFQLPYKPIDQAPKRFAAKIGFTLTIAILATHIISWINLSHLLAMVIILFALLESVFGFCAGCHVYTIYKKLSAKENSIDTGDVNKKSTKVKYSFV